MPSSKSSAAQELLSRINAEARRRRAIADNTTIDEVLNESRARCSTLTGYMHEAWHVLEPANAYVHGWHIDAVAEHLEAVSSGQITRLLINEPAGMMKSLQVGVFWQTYEWGPLNKPHLRTVATSYKETLTKRDNIKARRLVKSDWFQSRWGQQFVLMADQDSTIKFENDKTGFRAAMVFNSLTGERGDRVSIDDPLSVAQAKSDTERKTAEETFLEAVPNRLVDPKSSAIILIMQRLHERDPAGIAIAKNLGYVHLMLPMEYERERSCYTVVKPKHFDAGPPIRGRYDAEKQIWYREGQPVPEPRREYVEKAEPQTVYRQDKRTREGELLFPERFPREAVEKLKISLGSWGHAGQDQQRPAPREGGMFKRHWFDGKIIKAVPFGTRWVRHWDLAATQSEVGARTAGVKMGRTPDGRYLIGHVIAAAEEGQEVRRLIKSTAEVDGHGVEISLPQDPGQAGKVQARDYVKMLAGYNVRTARETGDKITRAEPFAAQCEGGNVFLLEGPWIEGYLDEICQFPGAARKDFVDASSGAFGRLVGSAGYDPNSEFSAPKVIDAE
jgi:predicted phage terminase large subunit-like protein